MLDPSEDVSVDSSSQMPLVVMATDGRTEMTVTNVGGGSVANLTGGGHFNHGIYNHNCVFWMGLYVSFFHLLFSFI